MIKSSELKSRTGTVIQHMLQSTFTVDEVAIVLGAAETGAAFSRLAFDHLLFTGSTVVGGKIMQAASDSIVPLTVALENMPFGGIGPSRMGAYHGIDGFAR